MLKKAKLPFLTEREQFPLVALRQASYQFRPTWKGACILRFLWPLKWRLELQQRMWDRRQLKTVEG